MNLALQGLTPQIVALESQMRAMGCTNDLPVEHYQIEGVYVRSLFIPQGTVLTGKIHNKENIAILAHGTIRINRGDKMVTLSAPQIMVDKAGVKRVGLAITDCTFINVCRTDKIDIAEIEEELVCDTFEEFENKLLGAL